MSLSKQEIDGVVDRLRLAGHDAATCGRTIISKVGGVSERQARRLQETLRGGKLPPNKVVPGLVGFGEPKNSREDELTKDGWTINLVSDRVRDYDGLVKECGVDLSVWEPERFKCKSYEVTYVPRSVRSKDAAELARKGGDAGWYRESTEAVTVPMFAITASFVRKSFQRLKAGDKGEFLKQFREILCADQEFSFQPRVEIAECAPVVRKKGKEIVVAALSDIHLTETVRMEDANSVNAYNSVVAANRLWDYAQQLKAQVRERQILTDVEKIWVPLVGDTISGTVHPEFLATNDLPDAGAVILGARLLRMFFTEVSGLGLPMEVSASHGNHPRTTPKMPTKNQALTNRDWEVYEMVSDGLASNDQIQFDISTAQIGVKYLYGWRYLHEHGIGAKDVDALESHLRDLFDSPVYREATGHKGTALDMVVIGDRHRPEFRERVIINGSLIGQNELGQSWRLKPIRAEQLMWGVTEKRVRTWMHECDVTSIRHERTENPFAEYAAWFLKRHGKH